MESEKSSQRRSPATRNASGNRRLVSFRNSLFLRFGLLGLGAVILFALGYFRFGVQPVILRIAGGQFDAAAREVDSCLQQLFKPVEMLAEIACQWCLQPGFSVDRPEEFNHFFRPILLGNPQITSVVAGTDLGEGWLLLEFPNDRWLNRITDIPRWGEEHLILEWVEGTLPSRGRKRFPYDPRSRPWFQGALATAVEGKPYWTNPYIFFTTKEPGITVSSQRKLSDGRTFVVGFDIKLLDLSRRTSSMRIGRDGFVLVLTEDGQVLGLPRTTPARDLAERTGAILQPVEKLAIRPLSAGVEAWNREGTPRNKVIRFRAEGRNWLAAFRDFSLGTQQFRVALFAPENDFLPSWIPLVQVVGGTVLVVLLLTLLAAHRQARMLSAPLEYLAAQSERIAHLDFDRRPVPPTRYREIHQLMLVQNSMSAMLQDFSDTVIEQARDLRRALNEKQAILENALVGIFLVKGRRIHRHNRRAAELLGYDEESLAGLALGEIVPDRAACLEMEQRIKDVFRRGENFIEELWFKRRDGSRIWVYLCGRVIDPQSPKAGSVWIMADLTEQKSVKDRLYFLGYHDPLTGLPNRHLFADRLEHAINQAKREKTRMALLFLDLDRFKTINDTMGHQAGDQLLCAVAERLQDRVRSSDTLARMGGDEFTVIVENMTDESGIGILAGKLMEIFSSPIDINGRPIFITASLGISLFPNDGRDARVLLQNADAAMYQAKEQGGNIYHFYSEEMTVKAFAQLETEGTLRHALKHGGLELHIQPQISLVDGSITGAEALVRLRHPVKGLIPPLEFIPLAEEIGLICELGNWVLEESCRIWRGLADQGYSLPRIAINVSARQLRQREFLGTVLTVLNTQGIPRGTLEMEITESAFLKGEGALDLLRSLGDIGVVLSLDDFGTGYSSLSYLKRLPIGKLKIDKSFIWHIGRAEDGESLVRTIVNLAGTLNLEVIAEGVETGEQKEFLLREGCRTGQGYLFAKPMPAADFENWVKAHMPGTTVGLSS